MGSEPDRAAAALARTRRRGEFDASRELARSAALDVMALALGAPHRPILVNSFGRSGSTVLYEAIVSASQAQSHLGPRARQAVVRATAWRIDQHPLRNGRVYKTHDYPPTSTRGSKPQVVYVFGDPIDATLSVISRTERDGPTWLREHCDHLRVPECRAADLLVRDCLQIGRHLERWLAADHLERVFVRYERMWDYQDKISDFLGIDVKLPPQRLRGTTTADMSARASLRRTYGDLARKIRLLPDYSVRAMR